MGKAQGEFKKGLKEGAEDEDRSTPAAAPPAGAPTRDRPPAPAPSDQPADRDRLSA